MPTKPNVTEIRSLTGLRGIAAIHVMLFHYFIGIATFHAATINPVTTFVHHGYLEVDLFFVLSGFVMALNYGHLFEAGWSFPNYFKFLSRRIARVYPLFIVMTAAAALLAIDGYIEGPGAGSIKVNLMLHLIMVQSWFGWSSLDSPAWSISAEWFAYLIFPVLLVPCLFAKPNRTASLAVIAVCVLMLLAVFPMPFEHVRLIVTSTKLSEISGYGALLRCVSEFALGILCFRLSGRPKIQAIFINRHSASVAGAFVLVLLITPRTELLIVLVFPFLIIGLLSPTNILSRSLASPWPLFAGVISYSIYLTHYLLTGIIAWVHHQANLMGLSHGQTYGAIVAIVLEPPFAYAAYRLIELPGRKWLRRAFEGRTRPIATAEPVREEA